MNQFKSILFILSFLISSHCFALGRTLVLVPGFFNSYVPDRSQAKNDAPYWSHDIVNLFEKAGFKVFVVNNLDPVGGLEKNGELLISYLTELRKQLPQDEILKVVAHSAGGLYTLYAQNKFDFKIKKMITLNTPFRGIEFIENMAEEHPMLASLAEAFHLESLLQLRPQQVKDFLKSLKSPTAIDITAYYGYQESKFFAWNAKNLSPVFHITEDYMTDSSDGIITTTSALDVAAVKGKVTQGEYIHLDHWKQVLDYRFFAAMGMYNLKYIFDEQMRFYQIVAQSLL